MPVSIEVTVAFVDPSRGSEAPGESGTETSERIRTRGLTGWLAETEMGERNTLWGQPGWRAAWTTVPNT